MTYKTTEKYIFGLAIILIASAFYASVISLNTAGCHSTFIYLAWVLLILYAVPLCKVFYDSAYKQSKKAKRIFKILILIPLIYILPSISGLLLINTYKLDIESLIVATLGIIYTGLVIYGIIIDLIEKRKTNIV